MAADIKKSLCTLRRKRSTSGAVFFHNAEQALADAGDHEIRFMESSKKFGNKPLLVIDDQPIMVTETMDGVFVAQLDEPVAGLDEVQLKYHEFKDSTVYQLYDEIAKSAVPVDNSDYE